MSVSVARVLPARPVDALVPLHAPRSRHAPGRRTLHSQAHRLPPGGRPMPARHSLLPVLV